MDPIANITEQRKLASKILALYDADEPIDEDDTARLAELVIALDEWQAGGGFSPYDKKGA